LAFIASLVSKEMVIHVQLKKQFLLMPMLQEAIGYVILISIGMMLILHVLGCLLMHILHITATTFIVILAIRRVERVASKKIKFH